MKKRKIFSMLFEQDDSNIDKDAPESSLSLEKEDDLKIRQNKYSLDYQIDSLLLRYENIAIESEEDTLLESLSFKNLKYLLREQDEEESADDTAADDTADDTSEPSGGEAVKSNSGAKKVNIPNINLDEFILRVIRLTKNYKSLLRIEEVIYNRAKNFLDENYGDEFVKRYIDTLDQTHGIDLSEFDQNDIETASRDKFGYGAKDGGGGG